MFYLNFFIFLLLSLIVSPNEQNDFFSLVLSSLTSLGYYYSYISLNVNMNAFPLQRSLLAEFDSAADFDDQMILDPRSNESWSDQVVLTPSVSSIEYELSNFFEHFQFFQSPVSLLRMF